MPPLAQKVFVERFLSWDRVRERLGRYQHIRRWYPLDLLQRHQDTPPYFCHYLSWRLGTWHNEALFARLDELLGLAEPLQGWEGERSMLENPDFSVYWSLLWQLQMAEYLSSIGIDVRCGNPGPDLSVVVDGKRIFVECFVFRKSFGLRLFLEDVLGRISDDIKLDHDYCVQFSLPLNKATEAFLDDALRPFLDDAAIEALRRQAQQRYPVIVSRPASTLVIYLKGPDADRYDPNILRFATGDPQKHLAVILPEALAQKAGANSLGNHRPNLVAVNYLLSTDAQVAATLRGLPASIVLPDTIDGFAVAPGIGVDARVTREQLLLLATREPTLYALAASP